MKITNKGKRNLLIILTVFILIVVTLLIVIIVQTVKLNKIKGENASLDSTLASQREEINLQESKEKYYESEQFKEDYAKYELGYTKGDSTVYK